MKTIAALLLVVGIALLGVGVYQWQDGLNMQNLTELQERQMATNQGLRDWVHAGEDKEVLGLTLLTVGGVLTLGSGVVLLRKSDE